ncbi:MAG: hypothetical protein ABIM02_05960 [candidate division WOR-3 bacterium]
MVKILSLDDYVNSFVRAFSDEYEVVKAFSFEEAKEKMGSTIKLALVDIRLSETDMSNRDGIIF